MFMLFKKNFSSSGVSGGYGGFSVLLEGVENCRKILLEEGDNVRIKCTNDEVGSRSAMCI